MTFQDKMFFILERLLAWAVFYLYVRFQSFELTYLIISCSLQTEQEQKCTGMTLRFYSFPYLSGLEKKKLY